MNKTALCKKCQNEYLVSGETSPEMTEICPTCSESEEVFGEDTWVPSAHNDETDVDPVDMEIDGYEILDVLGRGGMGVVFEGRQLSLGRRVAIKCLSPNLSRDESFVERFSRESSTLASLAHPNIVTIFERGTSNGQLFFIMEYVAGVADGPATDLRDKMKQRKLTSQEIFHYVSQISEALAYTHRQGIVHRDIKPSNILIDRHNHVKIADFGIASNATLARNSALTAPSSAIGTFDYMAPEQHAGVADIDVRADIYSLGVILYEMLTGQLPRGAYELPSKLVPGLDAVWDELVHSMLQPDPDKRMLRLDVLLDRLDQMTTTMRKISALGLGGENSGERATHSTDSHIQSLTCHRCDNHIEEHIKYCPNCRSLQFGECPECHSSIRIGLHYCPECGREVGAALKHQAHLSIAKHAIRDARKEEATCEERYQSVQRANAELNELSTAGSPVASYQPLLDIVNQLESRLLKKLSRTALREKNFGSAEYYFNKIRERDPEETEAQSQLEQIDQFRSSLKSKINKYREQGDQKRYAAAFDKYHHHFPEDTDSAAKFQQDQTALKSFEETIRKRLPKLAEQKKFWEIRTELEKFEDVVIKPAWLADYSAKVTRRLAEMETVLGEAEAHFQVGHFKAAGKAANKVLAKISDHPRAQEIRATSLEYLGTTRAQMDKIGEACRSGRWFLGAKLLDSNDNLPDTAEYRQYESEIRAGRSKSNEFICLLLWTIGGMILLVLSELCGNLISVGVVRYFSNSGAITEYFDLASLKRITAWGAFTIFVCYGLLLLRKLLGRPVSAWQSTLCIMVLLAGIVLMSINAEFLRQIELPLWVTRLASLVTFGTLLSLVYLFSCNRVIKGVPAGFFPLIVTGVLASALIAAVKYSPFENLFFFYGAIWVAAGGIILRRVSKWLLCLPLISAGLFADLMLLGVVELDWEISPWIYYPIGALFLIVTCVVVSDRSGPGQITLATLLTSAALSTYYLLQQLSLVEMTTLTVTLWLVLTAAYAVLAADHIDSGLHLKDRMKRSQAPAAS